MTTRTLFSGGRREQWHALTAVGLVPVILAAVALWQFYRVRTYHTTPWKGGGFGMFSTIDVPPARTHRFYLVRGDITIAATLDTRFNESMRLMRNIPQPEVLRNVGRELTRFRWAYPTGLYPGENPAFTKQSGTHLRILAAREQMPDGFSEFDYDAVKLEVWRYSFDVEKNKAVLLRMSEALVARGE